LKARPIVVRVSADKVARRFAGTRAESVNLAANFAFLRLRSASWKELQ
jgi:hypothetical protein